MSSLNQPLDFNKPQGTAVISVRLACVAYRDHFDEENRFQVLDFTTEVSQFSTFLRNVLCIGGNDFPEEVLGALDRTRSLNWSNDSESKQIFHIADAPAHGTKFQHPAMQDDYPDGHPSDPCHIKLFNWLTNEMKIQYVFGKINNSTDRMIEMFSCGGQAFGHF